MARSRCDDKREGTQDNAGDAEHFSSFRNPASEATSSRGHTQLRSHARTNETNTISQLDPPPKLRYIYLVARENCGAVFFQFFTFALLGHFPSQKLKKVLASFLPVFYDTKAGGAMTSPSKGQCSVFYRFFTGFLPGRTSRHGLKHQVVTKRQNPKQTNTSGSSPRPCERRCSF
jgi:hypothetical protein